jgi:hypothetical protein
MVETNKAVVRRFYEELWNQWRFELLDQIVSEGVHFRSSLGSTVTGREEF